ncbi:MAG: transglutaminase domain-containing protein [Acidobacteriota bacterium]
MKKQRMLRESTLGRPAARSGAGRVEGGGTGLRDALVGSLSVRWLLVALIILAPDALPASQTFVRGTASATYFVKSLPVWLTIGSHVANGYALERGMPDWEGRVRIRVTVACDLMQCRAPFKPKTEQLPSYVQDYTLAEPGVPAGAKPFKKLAEDLVHGSKYQTDAVEAILAWIGENVVYDETARADDPLQVLEGKRGYCVGISNLALTLLRSVQIPARAVQGLLLKPDGVEGNETRMDFQLHRFIEVYYPGIGWILSDPQKTVNMVSANYVYWKPVEKGNSQARLDLSGMQIFRTKEEGGLVEEDFRAGDGPGPVYLRKNFDVRYSAAIEGTIKTPDGSPIGGGEILVESAGGVLRQQVRPDGGFSFIGLKGGEYSLQFGDAMYRYVSGKFKLKDREIRQFAIVVEKVGARSR